MNIFGSLLKLGMISLSIAVETLSKLDSESTLVNTNLGGSNLSRIGLTLDFLISDRDLEGMRGRVLKLETSLN